MKKLKGKWIFDTKIQRQRISMCRYIYEIALQASSKIEVQKAKKGARYPNRKL